MSDSDIVIFYSVFLIIAVLFSLLINRIFLKFVSNLGIRNPNETIIRWSSQAKPAIGGISFFIIFLLSVSAHSIAFNQTGIFRDIQLLGILAATTLAFIMGLADDAYNTKPFLKFSVQLICSAILILTGTHINLFDSLTINYALTTLWIIGMMNSINMLDNMDAITTLTSMCIIISSLFILAVSESISSIYIITLIGVLGSLIGFLYYNWHPSKIYMGDTGSQFLGCLLSAAGILFFWNNKDLSGVAIPSRQIILVTLIFIIPLVDTTSVVINRLSRKQSPFVGGKDHTTHHLSYLGLSDRQVAIVFLSLSLLSTLFLILIVKYIDWSNSYFYLFGTYIFVIASALFIITKKTRAKLKS